MHAFPDRWQAMIDRARGHPLLERTWRLIEEHEGVIDWHDPLASLAAW